MLFGTSFTDRFIRDIFPFKLKVVPWHFHPRAILYIYHCPKPTSSHEAALVNKSSLAEHAEKSLIAIYLARQVVPEPYTRQSALVTTFASSIHTVTLKVFEKSMQIIFAAYGVIDTPSIQLLHILLSNYIAEAMHILKNMAVAYATNLSTAMMTLRSSLRQQPTVKLSKQ